MRQYNPDIQVFLWPHFVPHIAHIPSHDHAYITTPTYLSQYSTEDARQEFSKIRLKAE